MELIETMQNAILYIASSSVVIFMVVFILTLVIIVIGNKDKEHVYTTPCKDSSNQREYVDVGDERTTTFIVHHGLKSVNFSVALMDNDVLEVEIPSVMPAYTVDRIGVSMLKVVFTTPPTYNRIKILLHSDSDGGVL